MPEEQGEFNFSNRVETEANPPEPQFNPDAQRTVKPSQQFRRNMAEYARFMRTIKRIFLHKHPSIRDAVTEALKDCEIELRPESREEIIDYLVKEVEKEKRKWEHN